MKKCREQIDQSEQEVAVVQRELGRIQVDSEDQRDALTSEVTERMRSVVPSAQAATQIPKIFFSKKIQLTEW